MTRPSAIIAAVAVASVWASVCAPALAAPAPEGALNRTEARPGARQVARQVVMMCGTDAATRRAFVRLHGSPPVFVTAAQVLEARGRGEAWSTPRCMSAREHGRLSRTLNARA